MTQLDNIDKLVLRLDKLRGFVGDLKKYQGISVEKLESDLGTSVVAERLLELACESVLDIARLIVTDHACQSQRTRGDIF